MAILGARGSRPCRDSTPYFPKKEGFDSGIPSTVNFNSFFAHDAAGMYNDLGHNPTIPFAITRTAETYYNRALAKNLTYGRLCQTLGFRNSLISSSDSQHHISE